MSTIVPEGETGPEMSPSPTTGYFGQPAPPPAPQVSPVWATTNPPARRSSRRRRAGAAGVLLAAAPCRARRRPGGAGKWRRYGRHDRRHLFADPTPGQVDPALVDVVSTLDYGKGEAAGTGIVLTSSGEVLPITTLSKERPVSRSPISGTAGPIRRP